MMDKSTLLDYINGRANAAEADAVRKWAGESHENMAYLESLINDVAMSCNEMVAEEEYMSFLRLANKRTGSIWKTIASIAASVVVLVSLIMNVVLILPDDEQQLYAKYLDNQLPLDSLVQEVYVARGARSSVMLPDGSVVWLNSDSRLRFPVSFDSDKRVVEFYGEGYFDVVKNESCPMIVSLKDNYMIEVLGTQFNVRAYEDEEGVKTALYSGDINLFREDVGRHEVNKILNMKPNDVCVVKKDTVRLQKSTHERLAKISAWKKGRIYFDKTPLGEVLKNIERSHGVNINVADSCILDYSITARFENESAIEIMNMLRYCAPIDYKAVGKEFTLFSR